MPDGGVSCRFEMLTYLRVRSALEPPRALPSNKLQALAAGLVGMFNQRLNAQADVNSNLLNYLSGINSLFETEITG